MADVKNKGATQELYNNTNKIPNLSDFTLEDTAQQIDASDHDTVGSYGETLPGIKTLRGTGTMRAMRDSVTGVLNTQQTALYTAYLNGTVLTMKLRPFGTGAGKAEIQFSARVGAFTQPFPTNGVQDINFTLEGVGAPTVTTQ